MKSYKCVTLSLILLLSTNRPTFSMEGDFYPASKDNSPAKNSSAIATTSHQSPTPSHQSLDETMPGLSDSDDDGSLSAYYTPRASLTYTGLENFDNRSVDDLTQDQAFQALLLQLKAASIETNTSPATPRITNPEIVMGTAALGFLGSAITGSAAAIRNIRLDDTKGLPLIATELILSTLKSCGKEIGLALALLALMAETRRTTRMEYENNDLRLKNKALNNALQQGTVVIRKHEIVEQGLVAAEHKVFNEVHEYLCGEAGLIAKGSTPKQAVATLNAILEKNKKVTKKIVLAMADLEKIHADAENLLKDDKQYGILNPHGWFKALTDLFKKRSTDDLEAENK